MTSLETRSAHDDTTSDLPRFATSTAIERLARNIGQAARFPGDVFGLGTAGKAALARMDPDAMRPHQIAALSRALIQAELDPEFWKPEILQRWALIAHGLALAGHSSTSPLGTQLHRAGISEGRVTKLLTGRGGTFRRSLPQLLRLLASRETAPNWNELGSLILNEGRNEAYAEETRMRIAQHYFSEQARASKARTTNS